MLLWDGVEECIKPFFFIVTNDLAYYGTELITAVKSFTMLANEIWLCEGVGKCFYPFCLTVANALVYYDTEQITFV